MKNNVFALSALFLLILSTSVYAQDFDYTSTNDFDNSKSASLGNYECETNTDNGYIPADEIWLGNMYGDKFTYADADGITWKWKASSLGTVGTIVKDIDTTVADKYFYSVTRAGSNAYAYSSLTKNVTGDFDFRINAEQLAKVTNGDSRTSLYYRIDAVYSMYIIIQRTATTDRLYWALAGTGGTNSSTLTTSDKAVSFRMTRSGNTAKIYYDLAGGDSWTECASRTDFPTSDGEIWIGNYQGTNNGATNSSYSNFKVNSGTIASPYKATGNFIVGDYALGTDYLGSLTIEHSNLSVNSYIDKIEVLLDGAVEYTNTTDIITGSSTTYSSDWIDTFKTITGGDLSVKVYLQGGANSPIVTRIYGYAIDPPNPQNATFFNMVLEWEDAAGVDTVLVEGDWSGTPTNYTMLNTFGGSWYNYALNVSEVPSGDYYWMSWANNTNDEWAHSTRYNFTIQGSDIDYMRIIKILIALDMIDVDNDIIAIDETHDLILIKNL